MPAVDIYSGNALVQPKSVADFDAENMLAQQKRQGLQQNALAIQSQQAELQGKQNTLAQRAALAQAVQSGQIDLLNPDHQSKALAIAPDVAPAMLKTIQEGQTSRAKAGLDEAQGGLAKAKTQGEITDNTIKATEFMTRSLGGVQNPQQLAAWYKQGIDQKLITPEQAQQEFSQIPINDPKAMAAWIQQKQAQGISVTEKMKMAQQAQIADNTNKTHIQVAGMNNATSRANNAATIAKDYKVAGIDPQTGSFTGAGSDGGSGMAGMVDALASYKMDPNTAFARMPPAMKAAVIAQVQQKNPDYDPTTYSSKVKAAKDFSTGQQGNAMRSFAVGLDHLDQLGKLADALDNGNYPAINKLANIVAQQTGSPAPTNFDTAKALVGKEIIKAVVGSSGGVEERKHAEELLSSAHNPKQLKGVIATFQGLMQAQHGALVEQRRAAGLPDSTLPAYHQVGADASLHSKADAIINGGAK